MTAISNKEVISTEEITGDEEFVVGEPRSLKQIIADVQATNEPILLTIGGEPQMVCLSVEAYRALEEKADHWETVKAIRESQAQFERGESRPAREALEELGRKHGILR